MDSYRYLFPFEKVPPGVRVLLYGAGMVGQEYLRQLLMTRYAEVVGFLDKNFKKRNQMVVPVWPIDKVQFLDFDFVVVALSHLSLIKDVGESLSRFGVPSAKIVFIGQRAPSSNILRQTFAKYAIKRTAFERTRISIALKLPSSLGDNIQRKGLFLSITETFPGCLIDLYASDTINLHAIYDGESALNCIIEDGGALFFQNSKQYLLAMEVRFSLLLEYMNHKLAKEISADCAEKLCRLEKACRLYNMNLTPTTQNRIQCERAMYYGWNVYQFYNYSDVFQVDYNEVGIPLVDSYRKEIEKQVPLEYITFNTGNSTTSIGNKNTNSRSWPEQYFIEFIKLFRVRYPQISIVQIGDANASKVSGADVYILGENIESAKWVLKGAMFHLDTEGGLMHLATQLGTKCVALFGPTQVELFGYPENINVCAGKCHGCYFLYDNPFACARGMNKPECMYSITPAMVIEKIKDYMNTVYNA